MQQIQFEVGPTAVVTDTVIGGTDEELDTRGFAGTLCFEVQNSGISATSDFQIQLRAHQNGAWHTFLLTTDWSDPTLSSMIFCTSIKPNGLTPGNRALAVVKIRGAHAIRFRASGNGATLTVRGSLTQDQ